MKDYMMSVFTPELASFNQGNGEQTTGYVTPGEMQSYFGDNEHVLDVNPLIREDYVGYASDKKHVGGALVVRCTVSRDGAVGVRELTIDGGHRQLDESLITRLGAQAESSRSRGILIVRDTFPS